MNAEFEKKMDRIIDRKIKDGYDDYQIIDEISTGGSKNITTRDIKRMESEKKSELLK
jgi:hypothetical protein